MPGTTSLLAEIAARAAAHLDDADEFIDRLAGVGETALGHLRSLYGGRDDFAAATVEIFDTTIDALADRPAHLRARDRLRETDGAWYQRHDLIGAWAYLDRFSGDLDGLVERLPYLQELGVGFVHLMPIFARPPGRNDGGYAISDYRRVHPPLGSMTQLRRVATTMHDAGMALAVDFVFNHTASDHPWAQGAKAGNRNDLACYLTFESKEETEAFQPWLRAIFPDEKPGSFVFEPELGRWVWSTFHNYQWDLDYRNPELFRRMLEEMLFLANVGVDVLRLDAVPFIWKEPGTSCEGLPPAHIIIRALNALVRLAAPAMVFKSEAIVHPDEVRSYLGDDTAAGRECELAYNAAFMVELWEALATGYTHLLRRSMGHRFAIPRRTAWVNYVRSHDDIGWGFADEDAAAAGIDPAAHRDFLNRFYAGTEPGSFARGVPFQVNPATGDARMSGTTASLAGLERAMLDADPDAIDLAVRRILLIHGVMIGAPGIPLLNLGDELGTLNDYSYLHEPELAADSRWIHRPAFDWRRTARATDPRSVEGRIRDGIRHFLEVRRRLPMLSGRSPYQPVDAGDDHVYAADVAGTLLVVANFTPQARTVEMPGGPWIDRLGDEPVAGPMRLDGYGIRWLTPA